ncbi:hypothetical protein BCIN_08g01560 [Botrytis cinerea B05.10]|uniref:Uncharacterized protein n=1 Tax=Botryotinia fuckeliana (strain B05.10) TaxID=332648 RepID=A0A384JP88_BOTFB|nr:hypothetical protein BCIN_08g01560 [Botrytis cinerea B05.10]ATZ52425.1 hypothetical protein BCIN_08g01560 [Botrytis cinerea B05.10]
MFHGRLSSHPYLRPPSSGPRSRRQGISVNTSSSQTSSSSSSPYTASVEKKPISPEKFQSALKLYSKFRMKEGLALRSPEPNAASPSSNVSFGAPGPLTNASRSSHSKTAYSFDAAPSDWSSVISFETGSQHSVKSVAKNKAISYQGNPVSQRKRKRFGPVAKAKTALIRHLGACDKCRERNVKCPLEHHDIESLDHALQSSSCKQEFNSQRYNSTSPINDSQTANTPSGQATPITSQVQYELQGIGEKFDVAPDISLDHDLILSPIIDLEATQSQNENSLPDPMSLETRAAMHYSPFQHGSQFPLGVWDRSTYKCYFLDGECQHSYFDERSLQAHFEASHFEFTRIDPCFRCICTRCFSVTASYTCGCGGIVKLFICGNYIRTGQYPPEPPPRTSYSYTGLDIPTIFSDDSYTDTAFGPGLSFHINETQNFGSDANNIFYGDGSNMYPSPNSSTYDSYNYDSTQPGGNRYNGYAWALTLGANKATETHEPYRVMKFRQTPKHQKMLMYLLLSLILIFTGFQLFPWIMSTILKIDQFLPSIPTLGFIGFLISFATSWATRHAHSTRKAKRCKMRRCPLHTLAPLKSQHGQRVGPVLIHASVS